MFGAIGNWLFGHDRSIGFGLEELGLLTLRFPRVLAVFVVAVTAFCFWQLPKASVDGDLLRVYAHSGPDYDAYRELADTFGTFENDIYVLVRSPNADQSRDASSRSARWRFELDAVGLPVRARCRHSRCASRTATAAPCRSCPKA